MKGTSLLQGRVSDVQGRPRSNVNLTPSLNNLRDAFKTDENGYFSYTSQDSEQKMWVAYSPPTRAVGLLTIPDVYNGEPVQVTLNLICAKVEGRIVGSDGKGLADRTIELVVMKDEDIVYRSNCFHKTDQYGNYSGSIPCGTGLTVQARLADADDRESQYSSPTILLKDGQIFFEIPTFVVGQGQPEMSDDGKVLYSGRILNEDSEPIEGVEFQLSYRMFGYMSLWCKEVMTDRQGYWSCRIQKDHSNLSFRLIHPEYISYHFEGDCRTPASQELLDGTNVMILKRGHQLTGIINDSQGKPIENALVSAGRLRTVHTDGELHEDATTARTDSDGSFRIGGLPADTIDVLISATGYAPTVKSVLIEQEMEPLEVFLEEGVTYNGQVADVNGNLLEGVKVYLYEWCVGIKRNTITRIAKTDAEGLFTIKSLPVEGTIKFMFTKKGSGLLHFLKEMPKNLTGQDRIVMYKAPVFTGKVVDAETGKPVTRFEVINGIYSKEWGDSIEWSRYHRDEINSEDGCFEQTWRGYIISYPFEGQCYLEIQAEGYLPEATAPVELGKEYDPFVIQLTKGETLDGTVVDDQGNPAVNAQVGFVGPEQKAYIRDGKFDQTGFSQQTDVIVHTDSKGQFKLPPSRDQGPIVVLHKIGYVILDSNDVINDKPIQLIPWASITGTIITDKTGDTENEISVIPVLSDDEYDTQKTIWRFGSISISRKDLTIHHVPSIPLQIGKVVRWEQTDAKYLNPQPGRIYQIQIGGKGSTVTGRIVIPETPEGINIANAMIDPRQVHTAAFRIEPECQLPEEIANKSRSPFTCLWSGPGTVYERSRTYQSRFVPEINENGEFVLDNLSPGQYQFVVNVHLPLGENDACGRGVLKAVNVVEFEVANKGKKIPDIILNMLD